MLSPVPIMMSGIFVPFLAPFTGLNRCLHSSFFIFLRVFCVFSVLSRIPQKFGFGGKMVQN